MQPDPAAQNIPQEIPSLASVLETPRRELIETIATHARGPQGTLPLTPEMLLEWPSGDLFGLSQNVGMGWSASNLLRPEVLLLSTQGGVRAPDGSAIALGLHTGHWEVGLLVNEAATRLKALGTIPFAAYCTDPCDGRTQGTAGMMDSLPYRNDAATVFRRLMRSLPTRKGVIGVATCDKGLPAMMMALASSAGIPAVLIPGGVTLLPEQGEDAGLVQSIGARFAHQKITAEYAADMGCRACATPGGGCQFLGTAATAQIVGEALGMSLPHTALAPSGQPIWLDAASRSAAALSRLIALNIGTRDYLTSDSIHNAMVLHAAFGGSTNLLLHLPAIAFHAGLPCPSVEDWKRINRAVPRLVDALPNGPNNFATVQVFLAGAVPEVMLHLRRSGLLRTDAKTAAAATIDECLDWWEQSERRHTLRRKLHEVDGVSADDVIMSPDRARARGLRSTLCFPVGNLAPEGSVIKSTAIDPTVLQPRDRYHKVGPARVFTSERDAIAAIKAGKIVAGDILVLICGGPLGSGMQEIYQVTSALKHLPFGKHVAVITDARFSGVSTGACIGHVSPEALAGGPIGKLLDDDLIEIIIEPSDVSASVNFIGEAGQRCTPEQAAIALAQRAPRPDLAPEPGLPDDTRLWAALIQASGGIWRGCIYDATAITRALDTRQVTS